MNRNVNLSLSAEEALVLSDFLSRFEQAGKLELIHNAEFLALSQVSAQLDKALVEPLASNYALLVDQARERLAAGYEGSAPGVTGGGA